LTKTQYFLLQHRDTQSKGSIEVNLADVAFLLSAGGDKATLIYARNVKLENLHSNVPSWDVVELSTTLVRSGFCVFFSLSVWSPLASVFTMSGCEREQKTSVNKNPLKFIILGRDWKPGEDFRFSHEAN
jgi:hypothetical protein